MKKINKKIPNQFLQEGMTLSDRRYRIDSFLEDNGLMVSYKAYDTFRKSIIIIRELFPQEILKRDVDHDYRAECKKMSDEALFATMKEHVISRAKCLIRLYPIEGISNVLTYLEERETVYVVEEYTEGITLKAYLWKRHSTKFLVEDLMKYLQPVMETLQLLHEKGIYHGAITPETILITKSKKVIITGFTNPIEDVANSQLGNPAIRVDGYAPVELYLTEAVKGPATDIYAMAAILYRYVTGMRLPAYFERINEEKSTFEPALMQTRIMGFQSEAIMKGAAVYEFDRFRTIKEFQESLAAKELDMDTLHTEDAVSKTFARLPFWYRYKQKMTRRFWLTFAVALVAGIVIVGPGVFELGKNTLINRFYDKFNEASLYTRCTMLKDMSERERKLYTNDYTQKSEELTDEEKSETADTKYYDFQLDKYVTYEKFDTSREYYEYLRIDYRSEEVWINYLTELESVHMTIRMEPLADGSYEVHSETIDKKGNMKVETIYAKP